MVWSKRKELALLRGTSLFEYDFRDVEGAPPIAKDGVSALVQRLKKILIQALNQSKFFSLLYPHRHRISRYISSNRASQE
ncbi:unnamed protein product [Lupinus luteus]|uniref:Uncharacterized protein n=1 Tax=Lupinus luteus TaxID=3873 RepID=A0AAV1Y9J6_LUPLU